MLRTRMLVDEIKARMLAALKGGRSLEKQILSVALGEIQTLEARLNDKGEQLVDAQSEATVRKLIKSNRETLEVSPADQRAALEQEITILESLAAEGARRGRAGGGSLLRSRPPFVPPRATDRIATGIAMKTLEGEERHGRRRQARR